MSKTMKRVAFESLPDGSYEEANRRFKHQSLLQDYQDLQKEVEAARNNIEAMKQRRHTLLAEVRFLHQRLKFLLEPKSPKPLKTTGGVEAPELRSKKSNPSRKKDMSGNVGHTSNLKSKGSVYLEKKIMFPPASPVSDPMRKDSVCCVKGLIPRTPVPVSNSNSRGNRFRRKEALPRALSDKTKQKGRMNGGNVAVQKRECPLVDLNKKIYSFDGRDSSSWSRVPTFDLNQISQEEAHFRENFQPYGLEEEPRMHGNLKLSVCRNIKDGSTTRSRPGKRKISWQDPVALRV